MSIIVTGATGQYGRAVTRLLLERMEPDQLILTTRKPGKLADLVARGCRVRYASFDEPGGLPAAFEGGERMLVISTARVGRRVGQHGAAFAAARAAGVGHVAYTSFIGLHEGNPALIVRDHRATETLLQGSGLAWTALRDSQYAEAAAEVMAPTALRAGGWVSCSGDGRIAMVSRADCVACAAAVLTTPGHENKAYEITGPELMSYREICALASEIAGANIPYRPVTDAQMLASSTRPGCRARPRTIRPAPTSPGPATTWSASSRRSAAVISRRSPTTCGS
jgi:NAD(P)H dehydrogenase (quinone)